MFDMAQAQQLANKAKRKLKRNPEFYEGMPAVTFEVVGYYDRPKENKVLHFLGEGAWTVAFMDDDENVFLFTDEQSSWADNSKAFVAGFNEKHGSLKHIPQVESYGSFDNSNGDFENMNDWAGLELYISPLYDVPLDPDKQNHKKPFAMYYWLRNAIKDAKRTHTHEEWGGDTTKIRTHVRKLAERDKSKVPPALTQEEWGEFIENLILFISESIDFSPTLNMEIRRDNVGVDENGDLILLDIFYDQVGMDNI